MAGNLINKDDVFAKYSESLQHLNEVLSVSLTHYEEIISKNVDLVKSFNGESSKAVKEFYTAIDELNRSTATHSKLTTDQIAVQTKLEKLEAERAKTARELEKLEGEKIRTAKQIIALDKQKEAAQNAAINREAKAAEAIRKSTSAYSQQVAELSSVKKQLKDLIVIQSQGIKLNDEQKASLKTLETQYISLDKSVRGAEEAVGEYFREVGKYKADDQINELKKVNVNLGSLRGSINQLTREAPAFANSVNTGFLAISNNLPIFFDAIEGVKKQNLALQAQGEKTQSIFTQVAGAFFSWGTALSIGVTLLTVYGGAIVKWVEGLFGAEKALVSLTEANKEYNKSIDESVKKLKESEIALLESQGRITKFEADRRRLNLEGQTELKKENTIRDERIKKVKEELELDEKRLKFIKANIGKTSTTITQGGEVVTQNVLSNKDLSDYARLKKATEQIEEKHTENLIIIRRTQKNKFDLIDSEENNEKKKNDEKDAKDAEKKAKKEDDLSAKEFDKFVNKQEKHIAMMREQAEKERQETINNNISADDQLAAINAKNDEAEKKAAQEKEDFFKQLNQIKLANEIWANDEALRLELARIAKEKQARAQALNNQLVDIEKVLQAKNSANQKAFDVEISMRQSNIQEQEKLAEAGKTNQLAFEKEQLAKEQLAKRDNEKKIQQALEVTAFIKAYTAYLEKDPNTALAKASRDVFQLKAAEALIQGAFIEGTENVERDLKGNKMHGGKDGYYIAVDGKERILSPDQNVMVGNMSNDDLASLAHDFNMGKINTGNEFSENVFASLQLQEMSNMNSRLASLEKAIVNKKELNVDWNKLGEMFIQEKQNGHTNTTTYSANRVQV